MGKQWHPLFAHLLGLLLRDYYEIQTEVPVSDLPRAGDLLVLRRQGAKPPFRGLWEHLTEWNVLEFKGPTDDAEEQDLEKLIHVGTGLCYRLNEDRGARREAPLANRQVSFWYLAPRLGETFLGHAQGNAHVVYQTGGLWRCTVWGHPVWLVSYRDSAIEIDTIPLHLLDREPPAPRALGELVVQQQELLSLFATWLSALQPNLWEEIRLMAAATTEGVPLDWEKIAKFANLDEVVRVLPPERVVQILGVRRAVEVIGLRSVVETVGLPSLIETVGLPSLIETVGLPSLIAAAGVDKVLDELLASLPPERVEEMLRQRLKKDPPAGGNP
jgi:hypothetical protein